MFVVIVFYPILLFVDPEPFWLLEVDPVFWNSSQPGQLYSGLPKYAEHQRVEFEKSVLDEIAAEAAVLAEIQTSRPSHCCGQYGDRQNDGSYCEENGCGDE